MIKPVTAAAAPAIVAPHSLIPLLTRCSSVSDCRNSAFTRSSSAFTALILATCAVHASLPLSMPLSCRRSSESVWFSCFGVALSRRRITSSADAVADCICLICAFVWFSSFCRRFSEALSPLRRALSMAVSSCVAFCLRLSSISCACRPLTVRVTVASVFSSDMVCCYFAFVTMKTLQTYLFIPSDEKTNFNGTLRSLKNHYPCGLKAIFRHGFFTKSSTFPELKYRYGCKSATGGCRGKEFPLTSRYAPPDRPAFCPLSPPP